MNQQFQQEVQTILQHSNTILNSQSITFNGLSGVDVDGLSGLKNLIRLLIKGDLQIVSVADQEKEREVARQAQNEAPEDAGIAD